MAKAVKLHKINSRDIEILLSHYFDFRKNIIVPNVSFGLFVHECDMLVVTPSRYAYEIEIKTSKSDMKADLKKRHGHHSDKIKKFYFAIPCSLLSSINLIPDRAGILSVNKRGRLEQIRPAQNQECRKLSDYEYYHLLHLGCMRMWTLKDTIRSLLTQIKREG